MMGFLVVTGDCDTINVVSFFPSSRHVGFSSQIARNPSHRLAVCAMMDLQHYPDHPSDPHRSVRHNFFQVR